MKPWLAGCIVASLLSYGTLSLAVEEHHEPAAGGQAGTAAPPNTAPAKPSADTARSKSPARSSPEMAQMDEHMKKMQALHERMMSAATPEERQQAMADARKEMQAGMAMMQAMMQDHGTGNTGEGMMRGRAAPAGSQMQMMERRLDMMQMMMQMMMDQQAMTMSPSEKRP